MSTSQPECTNGKKPERPAEIRGPEPHHKRRERDSRSKWYAIASAVTVLAVILAARGLVAARNSPETVPPDIAATGEQETSGGGSPENETVVGREAGTTEQQPVPEDEPGADESAGEQDEDVAGNIVVQGSTDDTSPADESGEESGPISWGAEIGSLSDLGSAAGSQVVVFVYVPASDSASDEDIRSAIEAAATDVREEGLSVGLFALAADAGDYSLIEAQYSTPSVVILVRGAGGAVVSEEITADTLLAGVAAAQPNCC